jgi:3',5'-cyclic AMP phosphodiesterase CpdA
MLIAQILDLHVKAAEALYGGLVPSNRLAGAAVRHLNALRPRPDLVIITGDLTDEGTDADYAALRPILNAIEIPTIVLPGNHDQREAFCRCFANHAYLPAPGGPLNYRFDAHPLSIVALDSSVPGHHHGDCDAASLAWLGEALAQDLATPTLVVMHHHPFSSGIPFLDQYRNFGAAALEAVIGGCDHVERVLCGHTHRFMARRFGRSLALSCPSTASQIALRLDSAAEPASVLEPPACLLHLWRPGEGLVTHFSPIGDYGAPLAFF